MDAASLSSGGRNRKRVKIGERGARKRILQDTDIFHTFLALVATPEPGVDLIAKLYWTERAAFSFPRGGSFLDDVTDFVVAWTSGISAIFHKF